jgi:hypothetical protein
VSLVITAVPSLLILHSVEAILIAQWTQWSPDCKIWNHSTSMHNWRYWQQSVQNYGLYCASAEVSGFLVYQHHIKGIVLYYWSSLRCIKCWIVIYYRGLKFPHRAVVLLVLETDGACTSLNGHSGRKIAVLVLVCWYKARCDREQDLWRSGLTEGCIKQWYDQVHVLFPQQQVFEGGAMKQWPCCISYLGQAVRHTEWKQKIRNIMIITTDHNPQWHSRQLCASCNVS